MGMQLLGPVYLVGGQDFNMVYLDWPANDCNTYLVDTGDTLVLVDCGCGESLSGILDNLREMRLEPRDVSHVLLTHAHLPHCGAAEDLRKNGAAIVAGAMTADAVRSGGIATSAYHYHKRFVRVEGDVTAVADGDVLEIGGCRFTARALPGHSADSMGYAVAFGRQHVLFCGDAVRHPEMGQIRHRAGYDPRAYEATLTTLLSDPPDVLYPGHGPFCLSRADQWIGEELKKLLSTFGAP